MCRPGKSPTAANHFYKFRNPDGEASSLDPSALGSFNYDMFCILHLCPSVSELTINCR